MSSKGSQRIRNPYIPKDGAKLNIPMTIDFLQVTEDDNRKGKLVGSAFVAVFTLFAVGWVWSRVGFWLLRIPLVLAVIYFGVYIARVIVFGEYGIRNAMEKMKLEDFKIPDSSIWSIYKVDTGRLPLVRFISGEVGYFVYCSKDVSVGKGEHVQSNHYRGIERMLNVAARDRVDISIIDYMESVSDDSRINDLMEGYANTESKAVKTLLDEIYGHMKVNLKNSFKVTDVYLISGRKTKAEMTKILENFIAASKHSNYNYCEPLQEDQIVEMLQDTLGVSGFSVRRAETDIVQIVDSNKIRLIETVTEGVTTQVNPYTWGSSISSTPVVNETKDETVLVDLYEFDGDGIPQSDFDNTEVVDLFDSDSDDNSDGGWY